MFYIWKILFRGKCYKTRFLYMTGNKMNVTLIAKDVILIVSMTSEKTKMINTHQIHCSMYIQYKVHLAK